MQSRGDCLDAKQARVFAACLDKSAYSEFGRI